MRNKRAAYIGENLKTLNLFPEKDYQIRSILATSYLWNLLYDALEPMQQMIYDYLSDCHYGLSSTDVAAQFDLKINYASTILKQLFDYGLLIREEIKDSTGKHYRYKAE